MHNVQPSPTITHKYKGSQQFSRVEYSTQIYSFDTRGAKEYCQLLAAKLSIKPYLKDFVSAAKCLVTKQYGSNGNGGKTNSSSFVAIITMAMEK